MIKVMIRYVLYSCGLTHQYGLKGPETVSSTRTTTSVQECQVVYIYGNSPRSVLRRPGDREFYLKLAYCHNHCAMSACTELCLIKIIKLLEKSCLLSSKRVHLFHDALMMAKQKAEIHWSALASFISVKAFYGQLEDYGCPASSQWYGNLAIIVSSR